jgi:hypothetical protein
MGVIFVMAFHVVEFDGLAAVDVKKRQTCPALASMLPNGDTNVSGQMC